MRLRREPPQSRHKYVASFVFEDMSRRATKFGARGYSDYTMHKNKERRNRYLARHKKDVRTNDPTRAGFLSMFLLWNKPTLTRSFEDYKARLDTYNKTGTFPVRIVH